MNENSENYFEIISKSTLQDVVTAQNRVYVSQNIIVSTFS